MQTINACVILCNMSLTYTEIEEQKNTRILFFFAVVLLFYFLTALIIANAAKLFFLTQWGAKIPAQERMSPFLSGRTTLHVLAFACAAAVLHSLYSIYNATQFIQRNLRAEEIDLSDKYHKRFRSIVDEVNVATGNKYKITPAVIPVLAMNAFAISDFSRRAIIGVTEGLLSKLNRQQLQAVVAHEVAHVASGDSLQTTIACSLFGIYAAMLNGMRNAFSGNRIRYSRRGSGAGGVVLFMLFIYMVLSVMHFFYSLIRFTLSRERELRADAIAVRLTRDPLSLSEALYAISRGWRGLGSIDENLEALFIMNPVDEATDEKDGLIANLFSTHPPIATRMRILAEMAHADVKNIQESVEAQEKLKENMRQMPTEKKQARWMFMDEQKKWQGPMTISQIMLLGWLKPDTWIKSLNNDGLKQAKDEALLKPLFDKKLSGLKTSSFTCPKCIQQLVEEDYEGTILYRCLFCGGILVEHKKMARIIFRTEKGFDERIEKLAMLAQKTGYTQTIRKVKRKLASPYKCQKCGAQMHRNYYSPAYFVEVDKCIFCGLTWFDKDELEMLQYLIESKDQNITVKRKEDGI